MGTPGPQKIHRYGTAFKLRAVQMSHQPGVLIKDVAESLCIHPFMLSRWRKEVRDGELVGKAAPIDVTSVAELQRLREVPVKKKPGPGEAADPAVVAPLIRVPVRRVQPTGGEHVQS